MRERRGLHWSIPGGHCSVEHDVNFELGTKISGQTPQPVLLLNPSTITLYFVHGRNATVWVHTKVILGPEGATFVEIKLEGGCQ